MAKLIDTLLLLALPASGKSEVRKYLAGLPPDRCRDELHLGPTVQLDDFPYVHLMRRIDDELAEQGAARLFFQSPDRPFQHPRDWRTLIELVNEDHADLLCRRVLAPDSASGLYLDRIDRARVRHGLPPALGRLSDAMRDDLQAKLERECRDLLDEKHRSYVDSLEGRTLVIEFARGGPQDASLPLATPLGYLGSIPCLSPALLDRAAVLYIWVTPEESRRKNQARTDPNDPGSILHHGVPIDVMLGDYGTDDMEHLLASSGRADHIRVPAYGQDYFLPVARFDNRVDKTSFVRGERASWAPADERALHDGLAEALGRLARVRG